MESISADAKAPTGLAGHLARSVLALRRRLRREAGLGELTASQTTVLGLLERDGAATVTELARAEGVRPQSMGATVAALENAGLISGQPDPKDGRRTILTLTPKRREWIATRRAVREDWLVRAIEAKLSSGEQAELERCIELLDRLAAF